MEKIIIPKKITKKTNNKNGIRKIYHYVLDYISKYIVVYTCLETNKKECFQKKDFITYDIMEG